MEFWLHLRFAHRRPNALIAALLMIHLISMARCDWTDGQRVPASDQSRQLARVTPFDGHRWQHATAAAARSKWTAATLDNRINVNDQAHRTADNETWRWDAKRKLQHAGQVDAVHRHAVNGSDTLRQLRWQSVDTKHRPSRIDQFNRIPKKNAPNLLTNQFSANSVIKTMHTNTVRVGSHGSVNHETDTVEFEVKSLRRNCAQCRITPGQPIRAHQLYPAHRGM